MTKPVLRVWMLSDGRPGHFNQTLGVIEALKSDYKIECHEISARLRAGLFRSILRFVCNLTHTAFSYRLLKFLVALGYKKHAAHTTPPDLILSCGGHTSFLNIFLARKTKARNMFLGTLRGLKPDNFTAVISGLHIPDTPNLIELEISPGILDVDQMNSEGARFVKEKGLQSTRLWAMLIGGKGAGYQYNEQDIMRLLEFLRQAAITNKISWLITTSRRTSRKHEQMIDTFVAQYPQYFAHIVLFNRNPQKIMQAYLGAAELIACTEDSSSMISEAISAGKPVITLHPEHSAPNANYRLFLQKHIDSRHIVSMPLASTKDELEKLDHSNAFTPLATSTHADIASKVSAYLNA